MTKGGDRPGRAGPTRPALRASRPTMSCCCGAGRCCCWRPAAQRLTTLPDLSPSTLNRALKLAVEHVGDRQRRLTLSQWNGEPILDSAVAPVLERLGFRREALVYVREA